MCGALLHSSQLMIAKLERSASHDSDSPQIWALSDGRAGNARQAEAMAAALGAATRTLYLEPRAPGRRAALATRLLRARGATAVQILDPRIGTRHWDAVIAPEHDGLSGANVITLLGSLHPVDDAWLQRARAGFAQLDHLPGPRSVVL